MMTIDAWYMAPLEAFPEYGPIIFVMDNSGSGNER